MEKKTIIKIEVVEKSNKEYAIRTSGNKEDVNMSTTKIGNDYIITIRR